MHGTLRDAKGRSDGHTIVLAAVPAEVHSRRKRQGRDAGYMQAYLARRLLALIPALFFASLIVFVIVRLVPGDVIDMMLSPERRRRQQAVA